jgi:hypothetical protein
MHDHCVTENPPTDSGTWLTIGDRYGRTGGPIMWAADAVPPKFAVFSGRWPIISIELGRERCRTRLQTGLQVRNCRWHAHVPRGRLGIPPRFRIGAAESRSCRRDAGGAYVFDFTGMTPLPTADVDRRLIVLLDEIDSLQRHHPEVLDRLGIEVRVLFRDELEDEPIK